MGVHKLFWLLLIFAVFGGGIAFSETVSIIIVETGISSEASAIESSSIWESGLMDVLFEHGHIVSNAPVLRLKAEQANPYPSEQLFNIDEVREGGSAYYILAVLNYIETNERTAIPSSISLRLVHLHPDSVLHEMQIDGTKIKDLNDEWEQAKKTANVLIPYLRNMVSRRFFKMTGSSLFGV